MALTKIGTDGVKDDAITSGKIPANAVGTSEIANDAVTQAKIADGAVTEGQIGSLAVVSTKLAPDAVTDAKLSDHVSNNSLRAVGTNHIKDGNVTAAKLASGVQTTINNNADNRVITGSGTANTLEGESNLTFALSGSDPVLTVQGTSAGHAQLSLKTGGTTDHCSINFGDSGDGDIGEIRYTHSSDAMQFDTNNTERMRIDSSGRVHIGTATNRLGEALHVLGNGIVTSSAENTNLGLFGTFGGSDLLIGSFNANNVVVRRGNNNVARFTANGFLPN